MCNSCDSYLPGAIVDCALNKATPFHYNMYWYNRNQDGIAAQLCETICSILVAILLNAKVDILLFKCVLLPV